MKFGTRVRLKRWNDRGEFELDRANSKNNIAENSVALGHDTHNSCSKFSVDIRTWRHRSTAVLCTEPEA